ncbi:MAG: hypothetical protein JXA67_07630, partial [Micromonosporaceae bacterium]|nr:hypothetical protein [Micromonosporaceae bacterium]
CATTPTPSPSTASRKSPLKRTKSHHDGAVPTLLCLSRAVAASGGKSLPNREVLRAILTQTGDYIAEGTVNRSLPRLVANCFVEVDYSDHRHPKYRPTPFGEKKARLVAFVLDALDHRDDDRPDNDHRDDG